MKKKKIIKHSKSVKDVRKMVDEIVKNAPLPVNKKGKTIIEKNGKVYTYYLK